MPKPTEEAVLESLRKNYESINRTYSLNVEFKPEAVHTRDFVRIARFLWAETPCLDALAALEAAMLEKFEERTGQTLSMVKKRQVSFASGRKNAYPSLAKDPTKHLLTEVLAEHEIDHGFQLVERNADGYFHPISYYGDVPTFGKHIRALHLAKDYVGGDHGEYSHRIQWYLIGRKRDAIGLQKTVIELFKLAGMVWVPVFDLNDAPDGNDFRKPENLTKYLCSSAGDAYPLLSSFIRSRRDRLGRGYTTPILKINIAKKLFGKQPPPGYLKLSTVQADAWLTTHCSSAEIEEIEGFFRDTRVLDCQFRPYRIDV